MPIIDCQVHCYEADTSTRPWQGHLPGPEEITGHQMAAVMDQLGIDGAILVSPWSLYRFDSSYAEQIQADLPERFALVKPFDPHDPDVENQLSEWATRPGVVGARVMMGAPASTEIDPHGVVTLFRKAAELNLPVNVLAWGNLDRFEDFARAHPNTQLVLDHLGLLQPFYPPVPEFPWADLPAVLNLARCDNVAIKVSGACTLSHQPYPFADLWPHLEQIFEAFGLERCLWGTDWTRAVEVVSPEDAVRSFKETPHLSNDEKQILMGGTTAAIYNWTPAAKPTAVKP
jgi:predicted TIM-barrel fold metal-dependent hydrolase